MTDDLTEEKRALRARIRALRDGIPADQRAALGEALQRRLVALPVYLDAQVLIVFYSFGSEIPTAGIIDHAIQSGHRVFLPRFHGEQLEFGRFEPGDVLIPTRYGPKEPVREQSVDPAEVDLVVAPGLAFDRQGFRLGYGGGHYDRYLRRLPSTTPRVGIGFHVQLVEAVPHGPRDEGLDMIVTDADTVTCPPRPGGPELTAGSQDPGP